MRLILERFSILLVLSVLLAVPMACIVDKTPGSPPGSPNSMPSTIYSLFTAYGCGASGCHNSTGNAPNLSSAQSAYDGMVNQPAGETCTSASATLYVKPSDSANSVLVLKLAGTTCGSSQMPTGGSPMTSTDQNKIINWINAGAVSGP